MTELVTTPRPLVLREKPPREREFLQKLQVDIAAAQAVTAQIMARGNAVVPGGLPFLSSSSSAISSSSEAESTDKPRKAKNPPQLQTLSRDFRGDSQSGTVSPSETLSPISVVLNSKNMKAKYAMGHIPDDTATNNSSSSRSLRAH